MTRKMSIAKWALVVIGLMWVMAFTHGWSRYIALGVLIALVIWRVREPVEDPFKKIRR